MSETMTQRHEQKLDGEYTAAIAGSSREVHL
jgi:hypothetical protein